MRVQGSDNRGVKNVPIGIRNNNPLNLRPSFKNGVAEKWQGMTVANSGGFMQFDNIVNGWRAAAIDIMGDIKEGKNTLTKLINEFAPTSENDTTAYIRTVSGLTGFQPNQKLNTDADTLFRIMKAKFIVENGSKYLAFSKDEEIQAGVYYALNRSKSFKPNSEIKINNNGGVNVAFLIIFAFLLIIYKTFIN